jgi:predicted Zn-dependent peptidase
MTVTAEEVQAVALKYLDPDRMTVVILRPGGGPG